jgi:hypothetical protein
MGALRGTVRGAIKAELIIYTLKGALRSALRVYILRGALRDALMGALRVNRGAH